MPEGGGEGDRAGFAGSPVKTGLSGIPAAAGMEYNEKTRKIHTKTEKFQNLSVLYFSRLLTFPERAGDVKKGPESVKILHIVLAKTVKREYTLPR